MTIQEQIDELQNHGWYATCELEASAIAHTMTKMNRVVEMVGSYSHFCSGRDCTGYIAPDSGSLFQCEKCRKMSELLADLTPND